MTTGTFQQDSFQSTAFQTAGSDLIVLVTASTLIFNPAIVAAKAAFINVTQQQFSAFSSPTPTLPTFTSSVDGLVRQNVKVLYQSNFNVVPPAAQQVTLASSVENILRKRRILLYQSVFNVPHPTVTYGMAPSTDGITTRSINFLYQSNFAVVSAAPPAVTPSTWPLIQWPDLFVKPLASSQQAFLTVGILPPYSYGISIAEDGIINILVELQYQANFNVMRPPTVAFPGPWSQSPERFAKPLAASGQQFAAYALTTIPAATPSTWAWMQSPERFAVRYPASLQQFVGQTPNQTVPAATPSAWSWTWSPEQIKKPTAASLQQFAGLAQAQAVTATPTSLSFGFDEGIDGLRVLVLYDTSFFAAPTQPTWGWASQYPDRFATPYNVSLQQFASLPQSQVTSAVTFATSTESIVRLNVKVPYQSNFYSPQVITPTTVTLATSTESVIKRRRNFVYQSRFWSPQPFVVAATPTAALQAFDEGIAGYTVLFVYDTSYFTAPQPPTWSWTWSPEQFAKPYNVSLQQFGALTPQRFVATATPTAFPWSQSPERFAVPFKASLQRFQDLAPLGSVGITPQGWQFQQPERFTKTFPVNLQQFTGLAPQSFVVFTPSAFPWSQSPEQFGKLFPAKEQQFTGLSVQSFIALNPQTWPWSWSPEQFRKPFPASLQRFQDFAPAGILVALTPSAFPWSFSPERFVKPFPAYLQQFIASTPQKFVFAQNPQTNWWSQSPDRFAKTYNVSLQQFAGWPPQRIAPPPVPPPPVVIVPSTGGAGYGSRTPDQGYRITGRVRITSTLSRKEMEFLLMQLPPEERQPLTNEMDDEDVAFLIANMDNPDDDGE